MPRPEPTAAGHSLAYLATRSAKPSATLSATRPAGAMVASVAVGLVIGLVIGLCTALWPAATLAQGAANTTEPPLLYQAPILIEQPAPFVRVPLPLQAYAHSTQGPLNDLRVVDAKGQRVPFALLPAAPEPAPAPALRWRDVTLYPLPPGTTPGQASGPIELQIHHGRVRVLSPGSTGVATLPTRTEPATRSRSASPGWLIDLGEPDSGTDPARSLRLAWSGPTAFTAPYTLEHSADLRQWQAAGGGQLLALSGNGVAGQQALSQPDVLLPPHTSRYVRLVWSSPPPHPDVTGARSPAPQPTPRPKADTTQRIHVPAQADPATAPGGAPPAWVFDLGAAVPLARIELQWPAGTAGSRVLPTTVQVRNTADGAWQAVGSTVFYRVDGGPAGAAAARQPPAWELGRQARWLRLVPDPRAGTLPSEALQLVAHAELASLVFVPQGQPPFALRVGAPRPASKATPVAAMPSGALPISTLVPDLSAEQARFGMASVGEWREDPAAVDRAQQAARLSQWRPWLLWAVLLGGVATLGAMVWRLARAGKAADKA
ncbi:MAG: DUF3999 domain-containing protein [Rubrivivax sp.]|jgi:hypothetical protein|nr:DUF3999 domain-containing protein [Rubrivivax sp.]